MLSLGIIPDGLRSFEQLANIRFMQVHLSLKGLHHRISNTTCLLKFAKKASKLNQIIVLFVACHAYSFLCEIPVLTCERFASHIEEH